MTYEHQAFIVGLLAWTAAVAFFLYSAYVPAMRISHWVNKKREQVRINLEKASSNAIPNLETLVADVSGLLGSIVSQAFEEGREGEVVATWVDTLRIAEGFGVHSKDSKKEVIAYVLMRGYKNRVERTLVIQKNSISRKIGGRINLEPMTGFFTVGSPIVTENTLAIVVPMLKGGGSLLNSVPSTNSSKPEKAKKEEVKVEKEPEQFVEPEPEAPAAEVAAKKPKSKKLTSWKGKLKDYGMGERSLAGSGNEVVVDESGVPIEGAKQSHNPIKQYRLVIINADGQDESVWGQDLHRALKDSGAIIGDYIEILKTGTKILDNERKMNLYSINKIA